MFRKICLIIVLILLFCVTSYAAKLVWDANTESDLAGYKVYRGQSSRSYDHIVDVGNITEYQIESLDPGTIYYFAVKAYNTEGIESEFSLEVIYVEGISQEIAAATDLKITWKEGSQMAFGDIIQTKTNNSGISYVSSITATFNPAATAGNLLVCVHFTGNVNSIGPANFTEAIAATDGGNSDQGAIYHKIAAGGETDITASSDGNDEHIIIIMEIEGPWEASPLDKTASAGPENDTSAESGTTAETTQNDEFAVVGITQRNQSKTNFASWSDSYTQRGVDSSNYKALAAATKLLSATGAQSTVCTLTTAYVYMGMIATFKKEAAGPGGLSIPVAMDYYRQRRN